MFTCFIGLIIALVTVEILILISMTPASSGYYDRKVHCSVAAIKAEAASTQSTGVRNLKIREKCAYMSEILNF